MAVQFSAPSVPWPNMAMVHFTIIYSYLSPVVSYVVTSPAHTSYKARYYCDKTYRPVLDPLIIATYTGYTYLLASRIALIRCCGTAQSFHALAEPDQATPLKRPD